MKSDVFLTESKKNINYIARNYYHLEFTDDEIVDVMKCFAVILSAGFEGTKEALHAAIIMSVCMDRLNHHEPQA